VERQRLLAQIGSLQATLSQLSLEHAQLQTQQEIKNNLKAKYLHVKQCHEEAATKLAQLLNEQG